MAEIKSFQAMNGDNKILVTGANGYLGAQISQYLAKKGYQITALCYPNAPKDSAWCSLMEEVLTGSIAEDQTIAILKERSFDTIIHLVSMDQNQSQRVSPEQAININVKPAWNLLDTFRNKNLKNFIFFSTVHVYGKLPSEVIMENRATNPGNIYALTHSMTEQVCSYYNLTSDINCMTVRLSNSYGNPVFPENNCWWLAVNDLCRSAFFEKNIKLLSDGSPQRDFIHGSDVCRAVETLLKKCPRKGKNNVYHISSGHTFTILELAGIIKEAYYSLYGEEIPVSTVGDSSVTDFDRFSGIPRYMIDNSALVKLGFNPECDIDEGIKRLFRYFEKNTHNA